MSLLRTLVHNLGECSVSGNEAAFVCPRCDAGKGKRKLYVNLKTHVYYCFKCGDKGTSKELVDDSTWRYTISSEEGESPKEHYRKITPPKGEIPGFVPLSNIYGSDSERPCQEYLRKRGLTMAEASGFGWGISAHVGLYGRMIIPVVMHGELVHYLARSLYGQLPKEIGPAKNDGWRGRSEVCYGLDQVLLGDAIVLVEGVFDWCALRKSEFGCVALLGSKLSKHIAGEILAKKPSKIVLMLDPDEAGQAGEREAGGLLWDRNYREVYFAPLSGGKDPDEVPQNDLIWAVKTAKKFW